MESVTINPFVSMENTKSAIPLYDGKNINLSSICLDKITGKFPLYPLEEIEHEIHNQYASLGGGGGGGNPSTLP